MDLTRLNEQFQDYFSLRMGEYTDEVEITKDLFSRVKTVFVPFGHMRCSLFIRDEKPVLHVSVRTRMDSDMHYLFDGEKVRKYSLFGLDRAEKRKRIKRILNKDADCRICRGLGDGYLRGPLCGRGVFDFDYFRNLRLMEEKYGTDDLLELSKQKLTFSEVITIYSFIERADHHSGDNLSSESRRKDGTFENLKRRIDGIKDEM